MDISFMYTSFKHTSFMYTSFMYTSLWIIALCIPALSTPALCIPSLCIASLKRERWFFLCCYLFSLLCFQLRKQSQGILLFGLPSFSPWLNGKSFKEAQNIQLNFLCSLVLYLGLFLSSSFSLFFSFYLFVVFSPPPSPYFSPSSYSFPYFFYFLSQTLSAIQYLKYFP